MSKDAGNLKKLTIHFLPKIIVELEETAIRHDRSISWIVQRAWKLARSEIRAAPARARISPLHIRDAVGTLDHRRKTILASAISESATR